MKYKPYVLIIFLLFQVLSIAHAATFIMWAEGDGETLKEAKASAITALSQQVISNVESSFKTALSVVNDDVNRDSKSVKKITSNLILKGVLYTDEVRNKETGNIKITAGLDRAAIRSTIEYMKNKLNVDYSILSQDKRESLLIISDQLTAFVSVLPRGVLNDLGNIEAWNKKQRDLLLKNIYMGRVIFLSNTDVFIIEIDGKRVSSGVFLEEGRHHFVASADGFRTMRGDLYASAGEQLTLELNFIKNISNQKMSLRLPREYSFLNKEIEATLFDLGIKVVNNDDHILSVRVKDTSVAVDGFVSHKVKIRIEAYKKTSRITKVTVRKSFVVLQNDNDLDKKISELAVKGVVALMSRVNLDRFFDR